MVGILKFSGDKVDQHFHISWLVKWCYDIEAFYIGADMAGVVETEFHIILLVVR